MADALASQNHTSRGRLVVDEKVMGGVVNVIRVVSQSVVATLFSM